MNTYDPNVPPPFPEQPTPQTPAPPAEPPLPEHLTTRDLFEAVLRRPEALAERLRTAGSGILFRFCGIALLSMAIFGAVLGTFAMHEQLWAAPAKLCLGLTVGGLICFPSLFIFSCLAGAKASVNQLASCLAGMLALGGLLLLGCAPALWIFTQSTNSYGFMGLLGIGAWLLALLFGFRFLRTVTRIAGATQKGPIFCWSVIFLLVTLQMTTSLRPILGRGTNLFTQEKKFFLQHWGDTFEHSLPTNSATAQKP